MEHIVQFGISIDDSAVQANVEHQASAAVIKAMQNDGILSQYYNDRLCERFADSVGSDFCEKHKDEIIAGIVKYCGEKLCKRKSFTDKVIENSNKSEETA